MSSAKPVVLSTADWSPSAIKYMAPKVSDRGAKSVNLISTQSNRSLHITTPLMMTWGIADFVDSATGESDGKFSISLNFPNDEYRGPATDMFLQKLKDFENQILDDAVKNSELWWGEEMSREVAKHTFFPFLKYSKNKDTKKIDPSKPPSIRAKVPCYNGRWGVEIYDTRNNTLFPCSNENLTPMDFVPKLSSVACVLQCGGIWIGGKGWGLTWKLIQCVVKPREVVSVYGKCHIQLSSEDREALDSQQVPEADDMPTADDDDTPVVIPPPLPLVRSTNKLPEVKSTAPQTEVDDSDEEDAFKVPPLTVFAKPEADAAVAAEPVKKKVVKKVAEPALAPAPAPAEAASEPAKKKVVKKKV